MRDIAWIRERAERFAQRSLPAQPVVVTDTSDFLAIDYDHVLCLGGRTFLIGGYLYETRFGIDGTPKLWVKWATDLDSGSARILKFSFPETFTVELGLVKIDCVRSPEKEARILELVRGDLRFMQGTTLTDASRNQLRVLDVIHGRTLYDLLLDDPTPHEAYFHGAFPGLLRKVRDALEAIACLHRLGERHGDIRNDHLLLDPLAGGILRWIDFDLAVSMPDIDVFCAGNVLLFVVGHGIVTFPGVERGGPAGVAAALVPEDAALFFPNRIANLHKVYPYIPERLGKLLMRFSIGAANPFESMEQIVEELDEAIVGLPAGEGGS